MPTRKTKQNIFETEEGEAIKVALRQMVDNTVYNTTSTYSTNTTQYPDNLIPFVDKHVAYLKNHPATDPQQYLANLRLLTRIRK